MASTGKCEYCGSTVTSEQQNCPGCGAPNPNYVAPTEKRVFLPRTIEELQQYCAERGMPLLRMRFFIGEDFREPRAYGIYRDGETFVVYKNKADGTRAVRYRGPDEAHAVDEIFTKLLEECHNRGIYPDGKPVEAEQRQPEIGRKRSPVLLFAGVIVLAAALFFGNTICNRFAHRSDGYYDFGDNRLWYNYGTGWYYTLDDEPDMWYAGTVPTDDYQSHYVGDSFQSDWGGSDFKNSTTYQNFVEDNSSSSSDYDSWDSGGTDWSSDW